MIEILGGTSCTATTGTGAGTGTGAVGAGAGAMCTGASMAAGGRRTGSRYTYYTDSYIGIGVTGIMILAGCFEGKKFLVLLGNILFLDFLLALNHALTAIHTGFLTHLSIAATSGTGRIIFNLGTYNLLGRTGKPAALCKDFCNY